MPCPNLRTRVIAKLLAVALLFLMIGGFSCLHGISVYVDQAADYPELADGSSGFPFVSIQDAIDDVSDLGGPHIIYVGPGTYNPIVIDGPECESLRIESSFPHQAIIDGNNVAPCVKCHSANHFILDGFIVQNGNADIEEIRAMSHYYMGIEPPPPPHLPDNRLVAGMKILSSPGGGVQIKDSKNAELVNCHIRNNFGGHGAGIFALNTSSRGVGVPQTVVPNYLKISDCQIYSNQAMYGTARSGGALSLYSVNTEIINSRIYNNGISAYYQYPDETIRIWAFCEDNDSYVRIADTIIDHNESRTNIINNFEREGYFDIINTDIVNNTTESGNTVFIDTITWGLLIRQINITNSVIINNNCENYPTNNDRQVAAGSDEDRRPKIKVHIKNSCVQNVDDLSIGIDYVNDDYFVGSTLQDNTGLDPLFVDSDNRDYSLLWDYENRSPLINAGCEIEGVIQTDPDGTPPDIGAIYYPHQHREYFTDVSLSNIYWLSFPVVDDRTDTDGEYWNELGYLFEPHMQGPPTYPSQLNQILWSYDGEEQIMNYNNQTQSWSQNSTSRSAQPIGYKVQFNPGIHPTPVVINGFKANPRTTPVSWVVSVNVNGQMQPFENWVGYFDDAGMSSRTVRAGDALSSYLPGSHRFKYLDYVHTIKTRTWGTCRMSEAFGSPWIIDPNTYTFSEGDMAVLMLLPDAPQEMYWKAPLGSAQPRERPQATAFVYEEKLDYTPVFLEFDPDDMPDEVGLYVNGVCQGAAVVDSSLVDVCLYLGDAKSSGELQIMFYNEGKGPKAAQAWKTYNPESMLFEDTVLRTDQIGKFAFLSFNHKEGDSPVPLVTGLSANYPNPFNPSTKISFTLARDMQARLEIYNLRGQKVKTLNDAELRKGKHIVEWDGRDENNRRVSSGIYLYRLSTPDKSYVHKMMLMK